MVDVGDMISRIKKNLEKGYKEESIKWALVSQGYPRATVERAMRRATDLFRAENNVQKEPPEKKEKPKITYRLYDEHNRLIKFKEPLWKKLFRRRSS